MKKLLSINYYQLLVITASLLAVFVHILFFVPKIKAFEVNISQVKVNDQGFSLDALNVDKQWGLAASNFPQAWEKSVGSTSTVVAVIDTGIDQTHEDMSGGSYAVGYDFVNNIEVLVGSNSDDNGHGTLVASIIGARSNNSKGITGANWNVTLMPIKALDSEGRGDSKAVAKAIVWAADHKANVINLSFGGSGFEHDVDLSSAITYAFNSGLVIVASAGNDMQDAAKDLDLKPVFPVCNDNNLNMVIGVTAVDEYFVKPDFANYGKNCIDVAAPGRRILGAINIDPVAKVNTKSGYVYVSGTSLAAALVSSEAALIKSFYPHATNQQIRDRIISSAKNIDNMNMAQCGKSSCAGRLGAGLINAAAAVAINFSEPFVSEGDVVKVEGQTELYWIFGGQKRPISPMVYNQRFINSPIKIILPQQLEKILKGPYATPLEGTLVKTLSDPTVYQIENGLKLPITNQIFKQRQYEFSEVKIADVTEVDSWVKGKFLAPLDGTLVKTPGSKQLYWSISGSLHKINLEFYKNRGLWIFPTITVTQKDFMSYNIGEQYLR
jgi:Subtilase family